MTNEMILLLVLLVLVIGLLPSWPYSGAWGYRPSSVLIILLAVFFIWTLAEHRPLFKNTGQDIKTAVEDVGTDVKAAGRNAADSVRRAVQ